MKLTISLFIMIFFFNHPSLAKCNFLTSDHINELSDPSSISLIEIKVPKSGRFIKNGARILKSKSIVIQEKLKLQFKAFIKVHYKFGYCEYKARIRQSGDAKDHIKFRENEILRSLDVKLNEGNILNAVRFKLLLPETRKGKNEILASLIFTKIGIISPETFEVQTSVNGTKSIMLFQESVRKELLEKRFRREGPIFEGEERLIWLYKNYDLFELSKLSLSRVDNPNWLKNGLTSQKITLEAFAKLQEAYLKYVANLNIHGFNSGVFYDQLKNDTFINYTYALMAMNGMHGLEGYNRKFYYNSIESNFEPIYYDGNIEFDKVFSWQKEYNYLFPKTPSQEFLDKLNYVLADKQLLKEFMKRVVLQKDDEKDFFLISLNQYKVNKEILKQAIENAKKDKIITKLTLKDSILSFKKFQKLKSLDQIIINKLNYNNGNYLAYSSDGNKYHLTTEDLANLFARNTIENKRAVYLVPSKSLVIDKGKTLNYKNLPGKIKISNNIKYDLDFEKKIMHFNQTNGDDWVLLSEGDFSDWKIIFNGTLKNQNSSDVSKERFNDIGLTGCITVYKARIYRTSFIVENGSCEDSVNIINSKGKNLSFVINDAFSDAIDFDFSELAISNLQVNGAGNDCLDVSAGIYSLNKAILKKCGDKGVSVGEKSTLNVNNISINESEIGLAVKDSSILKVTHLQTEDVEFCAQVYKKKQEFDGAILAIQKLNCLNTIEVDKNSKYLDN